MLNERGRKKVYEIITDSMLITDISLRSVVKRKQEKFIDRTTSFLSFFVKFGNVFTFITVKNIIDSVL